MISVTKLRTLRVTRQLSLRAVSRLIGISQAQLSRIESNISLPSMEHLIKLARLYNVPLISVLEDVQLETITVQGAAHIGRWVTEPIWPKDQWVTMHGPPLSRREQQGIERKRFRLEGPEMDLIFPIGSYL